MWYLQDLMNTVTRQIIFRAVVIFLIGLLIGYIVGCQTPYTDNFLGQGVSVDDITNNLDSHVEHGECVTDGFDWLCRGELHIVTLEVIKEVEVIREVQVPVEVIKEIEIEKPITIKELYAVIVEPNETIQTPLGVIQTDAKGEVVSAPEGVTVTSVTVPSGTSEINISQPQNPQEIHTPPQDDGDDADCRAGYVVWLEADGESSGVICSDYVVIDTTTNKITFTGSDGEVDTGDSVRNYTKVEAGYTYEQASQRAPAILGE